MTDTLTALGVNNTHGKAGDLVVRGSSSENAGETEPVNWNQRLSAFKNADNLRAAFELVLTLGLFAAFWTAALLIYQVSIVAAFAAIIPAGFMMVRLFIIQHDCGHGAFFSSQAANDWTGRALGVLTVTAYDYWRHLHALHHASHGNLDKRGFGDVDTLTVEEYHTLSKWGQFKYRLYRNPVILLLLAPAYLFFLRYRIPVGMMNRGVMPWASTMLTNIAILVTFGLMIWLVGFWAFAIIHTSIILIGASLGVWLFFVQHQFDETQWYRKEEWKRADAALNGSSYLALPAPLMWATGYIGIHHVHHINSIIPFYRLNAVISRYPELKSIGRLSAWDSFKGMPLALWDEQSRKLVSFRQARLAPVTL